MENWQIDDSKENLLPIDDTYSLNLEDISTCGTSKENSESGISEESIQLTNATQSKESETSESIDLEQDTQLIPNNSETPASNIDISDKKVIEQIEKSVFKATIDQQHKIVNVINHFIRNTRLDTSIDIIKTTAIAAGNEASNIQRGVWMHGIYGVNNQGLVDNIKGYTGISKGGSIGFDTKIENDIIGVVYSNVHSVLKFKNNRNKEVINSYIISIYGQKELPKNFVAQALISVSKNFIKDKITYSFNNAKFKSNLKHRNYTYNLEGVLNYNHLTKNNVIITPNIGLRYGKSLDGVYSETSSSIREISLTMKENSILSGIVGTKVKIPLKDVLKFNNLGLTMHGSMEHNFNEKTQRVNMVIQISGDKFIQNYVIPKQPKTAYNLGTSIMGNIKNTNISLEYNYYLNKHYQSHQGSIKLQMNL